MLVGLRERYICMRDKHQLVASCMCPDWESNLQSFSLQETLYPTEPHQPGLQIFLYLYVFILTQTLIHIDVSNFNPLP